MKVKGRKIIQLTAKAPELNPFGSLFEIDFAYRLA